MARARSNNPDICEIADNILEFLKPFVHENGELYCLGDHDTYGWADPLAEYIAEMNTKTIEKMQPMMLINVDDEQHAMYWDDKNQVWNRARYKDLIEEAKRQLRAKGESE